MGRMRFLKAAGWFAVGLATSPALAAGPERLVSPEVQPDLRVTFRLRAPHAAQVQLSRAGAPSATMQRDADGVWSLTTEPLDPDYYTYSFNVDGVSLMDPSNPVTVPNFIWPGSQVHVPGPASLPWELNPVPHGAVHQHFYRSAAAGDDRSYFVYTPPGYDPRGPRTYPVLYLLHGFSDDASAWTAVGRAHVILDNLIARREAVPMLVVMPLGYGTREILDRSSTGPRDPAVGRMNVDRFREALLREVVPAVERTYRVAAKREARAIAGLSMGGGESLEVGLNALDRFAWIGAFSSGGVLFSREFEETFPELAAKDNGRIRLLWIACGTEDGLLPGNRKFTAWLAARGVRHTAVETPGAHTWPVWRRNLAAFLPQLFVAKSPAR